MVSRRMVVQLLAAWFGLVQTMAHVPKAVPKCRHDPCSTMCEALKHAGVTCATVDQNGGEICACS
jgi:hypothetical protein